MTTQEPSASRGVSFSSETKDNVSSLPQKPQPPKSQQLQHFQYNFPGQNKWTVMPMPLCRLLVQEWQIIIPLFQRAYCWNDKLIDGWWRDVLSGKGDHLSGHRLGKIMFRRLAAVPGHDKGALMCIDGQQRLTTTNLLLAALRDAAAACLSSTSSVAESKDSPLSLSLLCVAIDRLLFHDAAAAEQWVLAVGVPRLAQGKHLIEEGEILQFCRLIPSYGDRAPFFYSLLAQRCMSAWRQADSSAVAGRSSLTDTLQGRAKDRFDSHIRAYLQDHVEGKGRRAGDAANPGMPLHGASLASVGLQREHVAAAEAESFPEAVDESAIQRRTLRALLRALQRAVEFFSFIYLELLGDDNTQAIFLWLQEKSLFGLGALLYNPSPGLDFCAADLVRNLMLSHYLPLPQGEADAAAVGSASSSADDSKSETRVMEDAFHSLWYDTVERPLGRDPKAVDAMLWSYVTHCEDMRVKRWMEKTPQRSSPSKGHDEKVERQAEEEEVEDEENVPMQPPPDRKTEPTSAKKGKNVPPRFKGSAERTVERILKSIPKGASGFAGVTCYVRFHSLYEEQNVRTREDVPRFMKPFHEFVRASLQQQRDASSPVGMSLEEHL